MRRAGWVWQDIQVVVRDFNNENLTTGYTCFLEFSGPRGENNSAGVELQGGGVATFPRFALKANGTLRLLVVHRGAPRPLLMGTTVVPKRLGRYLAFEAVQDHEDIQVRAANEHRLSEQLQLMGNVGVKVLGIEAGGGMTSTRSVDTATTGELTYRVRVGRRNLTITLSRRG